MVGSSEKWKSRTTAPTLLRSVISAVMADVYAPPLLDIRFVLDHLVDTGALAKLPDFATVAGAATWSRP